MNKRSIILVFFTSFLSLISCANNSHNQNGKGWQKSDLSEAISDGLIELSKVEGLNENERLVRTALIDAKLRNQGIYRPYNYLAKKHYTTAIAFPRSMPGDAKHMVGLKGYVTNDIMEQANKLNSRNEIVEILIDKGFQLSNEESIFVFYDYAPTVITDTKDIRFFDTTNRTLVVLDNDGNYNLDLAKTVNCTDNQTIRITLNENFFYNYQGIEQRKITSEDFRYVCTNPDSNYEFNYAACDSFKIIDDDTFEITLKEKKTNWLDVVFRYYNYPYAIENCTANNAFELDKLLFSDNSFLMEQNENNIVLSAKKEGMFPKLYFCKGYPKDYSPFNYEKSDDGVILYERFDSLAIINQNSGDEKYNTLFSNINFRLALLALYDSHNYDKLSCRYLLNGKNKEFSEVSYSEELFIGDYRLSSDTEVDNVFYKRGTTYNEIVEKNLTIKYGVENAKEYFKKALEEMGTSFFKNKVVINRVAYDPYSINKTISDDLNIIFKEVFGDYIGHQFVNNKGTMNMNETFGNTYIDSCIEYSVSSLNKDYLTELRIMLRQIKNN